MKKCILFSLALSLTVITFAQDREYKTLVDFESARLSGMGGPFMQFTAFDGDFAHMLGGGGAIMLGDFWFGGYGLGLTNKIYADPGKYNGYTAEDHLNVSHGGFWIGYSIFGDYPIHVAVSSLIGWGQISVNRDYYDTFQDGIFTVSPTLEVELNLTQFFRISAGASYNIYTFVDNIPGYSAKDFSAPGGFLSFKFGWF